jgi:type II secretory pathway pseudopilin PulG
MEDLLLQTALRGSLREICCRWCAGTFHLCSACDRGHQYCSIQCRTQARRESIRLARWRYRHSRDGRRGEADRQQARRNRLRRTQFVTDHGQKNLPTDVSPIALRHTPTIDDPPESWRSQEDSNDPTTGRQSVSAPTWANQQRITYDGNGSDTAELSAFAEEPGIPCCARCAHSGWTRREPLSQLLRRAARPSRWQAHDGALH